jgi:hypothetical protein
MKFQRFKTATSGAMGTSHATWVLAVILLGSAMLAQAQYDTPQLRSGAPQPFYPYQSPREPDGRVHPGWRLGDPHELAGTTPPLITVGHTRQNRIGSGVVPLNSQYGVGDTLYPPEDALLLFGDGWVPVVGTNGNPNAVNGFATPTQILFIAVDEGVANVSWTNALTTNRFSSTYVIGPQPDASARASFLDGRTILGTPGALRQQLRGPDLLQQPDSRTRPSTRPTRRTLPTNKSARSFRPRSS